MIVSLRPVRKIGDPVLRRPAATYAAESLAGDDFVREEREEEEGGTA